MRVIKRNNDVEEVSFDKVLNRLRVISNELNVDFFDIAQKVCSRIYDNVKTSELDELAAHICSPMILAHPDYGTFAARIIMSNHQKNTSPSFSETVYMLYNNKDVHGNLNPLVSDALYTTVMKNKEKLNNYIDYQRDYDFDYFGFKTLEKAYLLKVNGKIVERPQHLFMRVALGIHGNDIKDALQTYDLMSKKYFTHATPTLFNAGTPRPQLSSCFLLSVNEDSVDGIFSSIQECAKISKHAGGIGIHVHDVRAKGSLIRGTNGTSDGIPPMLKVLNHTARYINQGGKRNGSVAVYLEPWHADIFEFLDLKRPHGNEEDRARDLFYALWIPDLFMERVKQNGKWSLMCPDQCHGLNDTFGEEFEALYTKYESEGNYVKQVDAQQLWFRILEAQIETGTPYLLFKDACNRKSNQKNLGTIKSSNLCVAPETMILTDKGYYPISELKEQKVNVWNGKEFSETIVKQTGRSQKLVTVSFDNGMKLRCTPYHKFYIETGSRPSNKSRVVVVEAKDLKLGMRIIRYSTPTINNNDISIKYPYTQGLFAAEGTYNKHDDSKKHRCEYKMLTDTLFCKRHQYYNQSYVNDGDKCCAESFCDKPMLWLYGEKKNLIKHVDWKYCNEHAACDRLDVSLPHDIQDKYFVPINTSLETRIRWLEGYLDGDGCVIHYNGVKNIQVSSTNEAFLTQVFFMLQTLGVVANISVSQNKGLRQLSDGKGGHQAYLCETLHRLNIDCQSLLHLIDLGFSPKRLDITEIRPPHHKTNKFVRVSGIDDKGEYDDTYCFNEPKEHKGIFNGVITGQCTEIVEYSSPDETAVCNLASICLPTFIEKDQDGKPFFNFEKLHDISMIVTKNLNKVIDINFYPVEKARRSNLRHRPIGIGVQGLADTFIKMRYPFDSPEAKELNRMIFETIYHGAVQQSMLIAKTRFDVVTNSLNNGLTSADPINAYLNLNEFDPAFESTYPGAYSSFVGSPAHQGKLQFDLWGVQPTPGRYDWDGLKQDIMKYGMRNSLLLAPMPTASTSQIMGFTEAFEAITSNIYKRKTMAGEFILVNKYLVDDLMNIGLWNNDIKNRIIVEDGSVQDIQEIPQEIKELYKTVWEIKQKVVIDQAADRGAFICQSQSMNLFMADTDFQKLTSMHFYS